MSRVRPVPTLLIAGLCCLLAALLLPGSAGADGPNDVEVSVAGAPFTPDSPQPLLDVSSLAPGETTSAVLGVRSTMRVPGHLFLRMHDVRDDDGGCVPPERAVDNTCGLGEGDLGHVLGFTLATAADRQGPYTARWSGSAADLEGTVDTRLNIASGATQWVLMTANLPAQAGRQVESDTFRFALAVIVRGEAGTGASGVGGKHAHHHGSSGGGSPLANTGVAMTVLAGVGALLVVLGLLLLATAWRRNRARSDGSDQGKHRSQ
jgi:hypothetical protein